MNKKGGEVRSMKPIKMDKEKDQEILELAEKTATANGAMNYWTNRYLEANQELWKAIMKKYPQIKDNVTYDHRDSTIRSNFDKGEG